MYRYSGQRESQKIHFFDLTNGFHTCDERGNSVHHTFARERATGGDSTRVERNGESTSDEAETKAPANGQRLDFGGS